MTSIRYYLAYGSNTNLQQMQKRCPTAKILGKGFAKGFELLFRGTEGGAVATIEPKQRCKVPVVIWQIQPQDEKSLDIYEGFPRLYRKESIKVELDTGECIEAMAYIINFGKIASPSAHYYKVIEQGYKDNNMNLYYLKKALDKCRT